MTPPPAPRQISVRKHHYSKGSKNKTCRDPPKGYGRCSGDVLASGEGQESWRLEEIHGRREDKWIQWFLPYKRKKLYQGQGWGENVHLSPGESEHTGLALRGGLARVPGKCLCLETRWECGTEGP